MRREKLVCILNSGDSTKTGKKYRVYLENRKLSDRSEGCVEGSKGREGWRDQ